MIKTNILIVEDEYIIAQDIKRSLLSSNYSVVGISASGKDALEMIEKTLPDLILMDIMLQGDMTGLDVAGLVADRYEIPVIFLTGYANESILQEAIKANPFGYILKPFEDRELKAAIQMALYKSKMENKLRESRRFLWNVIDTVPDYVFVKDQSERYVLVNKALADLMGKEPQEIVGKTNDEILSDNTIGVKTFKDIFTNTDLAHPQDKKFYPEQYLPRNDGADRWLQITKVPLKKQVGEFRESLGVATDITNRKKTEIMLKNSLVKMKRILEQTVQSLVLAVEMRDPYTAGHQRRVAKLAEAIGKKLNFSDDRLDGLRIAASIHDIGKIYVPAEILNRPGKISDVEFNLIKMHPQNGYDILKSIEFPWPIAEIVYQHHERLDGSGYPRQLKREDILMESQVLSVSDIVESMISHRPYRPSLGLDVALAEVIKDRGKYFVPEIVDICEELFRKDDFKFE